MKSGNSIYFIGIGGNRLSALAKIYHDRGYRVAGSDRCRTKATRELEALGIPVDYGHDPRCITKDFDLVVYTNAVGENNPQLIKARTEQIPVLEGAELLGRLMREIGVGIVAGTHGKTTTTAMIRYLDQSGKDPTVEVGAMREPWEPPTGTSPYIVVEALIPPFLSHLFPKYAGHHVDWDHPDIFPEARWWLRLTGFCPAFAGRRGLICWREEQHFPALVAVCSASHQFRLYSGGRLVSVAPAGLPAPAQRPKLYRGNTKAGSGADPGEHNMLNALAALATTTRLGGSGRSPGHSHTLCQAAF